MKRGFLKTNKNKEKQLDYEGFWNKYRSSAISNITGWLAGTYTASMTKDHSLNTSLNLKPGDILLNDRMMLTILVSAIQDYFNLINDRLYDKLDPYVDELYGSFEKLLGGGGLPCLFLENIVQHQASAMIYILRKEIKPSLETKQKYLESYQRLIEESVDFDKDGFMSNIIHHTTVCKKKGLQEYKKNPFTLNIS
jgi:hypothetical protein